MSSGRRKDPFGAFATLDTRGGPVRYARLGRLSELGLGPIDRLPFSRRVMLECALRHLDGYLVTEAHVRALANPDPRAFGQSEAPFLPARVVLQDFTGVPCIVDLAAMRSYVAGKRGDPRKINPLVPVDLVIDHSVQVDQYGSPNALGINADIEFVRNRERYEFLRWGQKAFDNLRVVPPATGIVHQVNLEYLAKGVFVRPDPTDPSARIALPDTLVGTDSHTTMINGLGVVGWGVGGIEAEAVMLGQPIYMLIPEVVGFRLTGRLPEGATATDLVLTVTEMLRKKGVVEKFVEFYGPGLAAMTLPDRATIANMAPEYGATMGFFPVDDETLRYLRRTGRSDEEVDLVERYCKAQGLFRTEQTPDPQFADTLSLDLSTVVPSLAGPKRPQDRVALSDVKTAFRKSLTAPTSERGYALKPEELHRTATFKNNGDTATLGHGAVIIAAITSCTNTSNPSVMLAAGLVARKAVEKGLKVPPYVKTSLAPGSRVVTEYLDKSGLSSFLDRLGFNTVGYGCTTCIGNSGPLPEPIARAVTEGNLVAAAVLSGNRNFEGRIHALTRANYLASPPLVVAFALAGRMDIDLSREPLGTGADGQPVYLRDIWPSQREVGEAESKCVTREMFSSKYARVFDGNDKWNKIAVTGGDAYDWKPDSTYIQEPPFFIDLPDEPPPPSDIRGARVLVMVGDSVTTDHISPAGAIKADSPAGRYLQEHGVKPADFNSYGARRGNDRVMTRGTFANIRLRNLLAGGAEGGVTTYLGASAATAADSDVGRVMPIFDAAEKYKATGTPLIVLAGREYGAGSSRDWAAKGTLLLGVRAVLAVSYERIHRSNLIGMGVLPLQFKENQNAESLGLSGREVFTIEGLAAGLSPMKDVRVTAVGLDGTPRSFLAVSRVDTPVEVEYYRNGGILQTVLRQLMKST
ncbi:MAG: aconitate hydratase AcnA [Phycisphaerae bacterium]|nr:aconitate hydratase AcnA [Phycisphaerae bacterium]NUQ45821.1 aconitate hydratase AcnA [Phycisphaerae bacterium]